MKNDLLILKKYESWFHSAIYANYTRALWQSDYNVLVPIYEKWTGTSAKINMSCSKCKLDFVKRLGKLYYKNKEEIENKEKYEKQSEPQAGESKEIQRNEGRASDGRRQSKRSGNITGQRRQPKANKGTKK